MTLRGLGVPVKIVPSWNYFDTPRQACQNIYVPPSRYQQLAALAEEHDGLFTSRQAREAGIQDSVLSRLHTRAKIERMSRGVYRIPYVPLNRFSQYREAVLWAQAQRGPRAVALSHETALAAYGISDANPPAIHLTVPRRARLRRKKSKAIVLHRRDIKLAEITTLEGLPVTTISRTVTDLLDLGRIELTKQAITDARREGYIDSLEAHQLRRRVLRYLAVTQTGGRRRVKP
jgi:predicted transcriptional regulator of viral defense system